jgi:hypothetical protein
MSEFGVQTALVRLLTDARLRRATLNGDLRPLTESGISTDEALTVLKIDRDRLEIFADMITAQRIDDLQNMLPITTRLLGTRLLEIEAAFREEVVPRFSRRREYALAFGEYLREEFERKEPIPAFLMDVLNYEMNSLELFERRNDPVPVSDAAKIEKIDDQGSQFNIRIVRPRTNCTLRLKYDVLTAISQMRETDTFVTPEQQPGFLLLHVNSSGAIEHDRINVATARFLELCDGRNDLGTIISRLAAEYGVNDELAMRDFEAKCISLCKSLAARQIVYVVSDRLCTKSH